MKNQRSIGSGTALAVPALRTVRAVLPHTALQSVVSSSGLARRHKDAKGEQPICREKALAMYLFDAVSGAANMRSDHPQAVVHSLFGPWTSAPCLTLAGTSGAGFCSCSGLHASTFLSPFPQDGFASRPFSESLRNGTIETLTPAQLHPPCRSPRLSRHTFLSFRLQPRGLPGHRFTHHASVPSDFRTSP